MQNEWSQSSQIYLSPEKLIKSNYQVQNIFWYNCKFHHSKTDVFFLKKDTLTFLDHLTQNPK